MTVSPFDRKAALLSVLALVCGFMLLSGELDRLFARSSGVGSGVIPGPSVRMEAKRVFLPLNSSKQQKPGAGKDAIKTGGNVAENSAVKDESSVEELSEDSSEKESKQKPRRNDAKKSASEVGEVLEPAAKLVKKIGFDSDTGGFSADIRLSGKGEKVTWFNLEKPRKLVVDLRGAWKSQGASIYRFKKGSVEKVVVGEHPDRFRLVFYLRKGKLDGKVRPVIQKNDNDIRVSF